MCHYGDINDCVDKDSKLEWNPKENRYIIPDKVKCNLNLRLNSNFSDNNDDTLKPKLRVIKIMCSECNRYAEFQIFEGNMFIGSFCEFHKNQFMKSKNMIDVLRNIHKKV